ncbi:hypothetical protein ABIA39_008661 [Nocardia sp. GAS34]|uniref:hypothetical protein n=1 Tax=unclassified Nocardia TaxID=2637762 RepID=UPI003D24564F
MTEPTGLIDCPFRALLHLPTWTDRRRVFEPVATALRPDGRFAGTHSPSTTGSRSQ